MAPYVFTDFPSELDAFTHQVVMGDKVRVRKRPTRESEVLGVLSHVIVPASGEETEGWTKVQLADERTGYVASEYLGSPIGYRAAFEKREGRWVMVFFVAGD